MVVWHHRFSGHEFEQALGVGDGQESLPCCSPWGRKELNMTKRLNWTTKKFLKRWEYQTTLPVSCCLVTKLCLILCDPMDCSTPGFPALHHLPELAQTHVHWVDDAIQPSHSMLFPSPALNLFQHQGLFQRVSSLHQVAKVLELHWGWAIILFL